MDPFFEVLYFDNTLWQYSQFLLTIAAAFIVVFFLHTTVFVRLHRLADKSRTEADDTVLNFLQGSLNVVALIVGIYVGRKFLTLTDTIDTITGAILLVLVTLEIARVTGNIISALIEGYINRVTKRRKDVNQDLLHFFQKLSRIAIWLTAIMLIINNLGFNIASLLAGLGLGGLAFALAAQQTLGNFFGSLAIIGDQPFQIGDLVVVNGMKGTVSRIGLRSTRITTLDGTEVSIPNSTTAGSLIENFSKRPNIKMQQNLGLVYHTSITKVNKAVNIARRILKDRKDIHDYRVYFTAFDDSALTIEMMYWVEYYQDWKDVMQTQHDINIAVKKQFEKEKIEFAFPTQTLHIEQST